MKKGFFLKLAWSGIEKNRKLYLPYYIACTVMMTAATVLGMLSCSAGILSLKKGADDIIMVMGMGYFVIIFFSALFFIYTHSFLIRRRQKEFGLYQVLGLDRKKIALVLLIETLISFLITVAAAMVIGMLLSKVFEVILAKITGNDPVKGIYISIGVILNVLKSYFIITAIVFFKALWSVWKTKPVVLLRSEERGEKPPESNAFLAAVGAVLLAVGYTIALITENAYQAIFNFFIAVLIVIVSTYILFISTSVFIGKKLKQNKKYYYRTKNFVSVSQLLYRVKRHGAGLASICILSTMVLVTVSSVSGLFFNREAMLMEFCPRDINITSGAERFSEEMSRLTDEFLEKRNITVKNSFSYYAKSVYGKYEQGVFETDAGFGDCLFFIPLSEYKKLAEMDIDLKSESCFIYSSEDREFGENFRFGGHSFNIEKILKEYPEKNLFKMSGNKYITIILNDEDFSSLNENIMFLWNQAFDFDSGVSEDDRATFVNDITDFAVSSFKDKFSIFHASSKDDTRASYYSFFGSFFFLGVFLSSLFLMMTVIIIYYKQLSEGYEDRAKISIMKKVGMTDDDIKSSIRTQMRLMFFLPLGMSIIHLIFAFPITKLILSMFKLGNENGFLEANIVCVLAFSVIYILVYMRTKAVYYRIVNGERV